MVDGTKEYNQRFCRELVPRHSRKLLRVARVLMLCLTCTSAEVIRPSTQGTGSLGYHLSETQAVPQYSDAALSAHLLSVLRKKEKPCRFA